MCRILEGRYDSLISGIFDDADLVDIQAGMPPDQPNEHSPGTDRRVSDMTSTSNIRDKDIFNHSLFETPVHRAEKPNEIIVPRDIDVRNMRWNCICGREHQY